MAHEGEKQMSGDLLLAPGQYIIMQDTSNGRLTGKEEDEQSGLSG